MEVETLIRIVNLFHCEWVNLKIKWTLLIIYDDSLRT